jgi:hypothetical protein
MPNWPHILLYGDSNSTRSMGLHITAVVREPWAEQQLEVVLV